MHCGEWQSGNKDALRRMAIGLRSFILIIFINLLKPVFYSSEVGVGVGVGVGDGDVPPLGACLGGTLGASLGGGPPLGAPLGAPLSRGGPVGVRRGAPLGGGPPLGAPIGGPPLGALLPLPLGGDTFLFPDDGELVIVAI